MSHVSKDAVISEFKSMYFSAKKWHEDAKDEITKARAESCMATLIELKLRIDKMQSAESESFEWCTDCKEYDQEAHCCHRWSKMIKKTVEEMKIVRCKDCKYAEYIDDVKTLWCTECGQGRTVAPYDFCSYAERREDG